jgi:hypothetical protein
MNQSFQEAGQHKETTCVTILSKQQCHFLLFFFFLNKIGEPKGWWNRSCLGEGLVLVGGAGWWGNGKGG